MGSCAEGTTRTPQGVRGIHLSDEDSAWVILYGSVMRPRSTTRDEWRSWAFDALIALFLIFVSITILVSMLHRDDFESIGLVVILLVIHGGSALFRRRAPLVVMAMTLASGLAVHALGVPVVVLGVATLVALYSVATYRERVQSLVALGAASIAMTVANTSGQTQGDASTILGNALVLAIVWFLGDTQRARRAYVIQLEERTRELESAQDELAQRAVAEERIRIARELHDIVAHSMGLIAVQAGVGAHVIESRPEEARRSLETIENTSRSALGEIRRMLGLLRTAGDTADTEPSPGLNELPKLADDLAAAGVEIDLRLDPPSKPLTAGTQLTIYRLVQEALTNVIKHSQARQARVSVQFVDRTSSVEIVDDGVALRDEPAGHGIIGMRERVAMHGGSFEAGPLPEGGFRVAATIPIEDWKP